MLMEQNASSSKLLLFGVICRSSAVYETIKSHVLDRLMQVYRLWRSVGWQVGERTSTLPSI